MSPNNVVVQIRHASPAAAAEQIACLLRGLRAMTGQGIDRGSIDADTCYVMGSTIDTLIALVGSLDVPVARAA